MNHDRNISILLVEDIQEHAEYTKLLLEKERFHVKTAASEEEASRILHDHLVDVVLMDVTLENGNGIDFCKKLRGQERFAHLPVIFLTSSNDLEDKISGFRAGADDYLTKPFKVQELLARIELCLQKKKVLESETKYRNFVEKLNDLVFMLDPEGCVVDVNPKAVTTLKRPREEIVRRSIHHFLHPDYRPVFRRYLREILEGKELRQSYIRLVRHGGEPVPMEINGFGLKSGGKIIQIQMVMRDISELEILQEEVQRYTRLLEEQVAARTQELNETQRRLILSEKMVAVGRLAAGIAHELRNPLSIIGTSVYYLSRVLNNHKNSKVKDHLGIIQSEITRSQKIITNLLDFSRRSSAERESADINKILRQAISLLERDLINHDIEIRLELSPLPLCFINVDEMKQAFLNLLLNAKDAMPNGGVLHVTTDLVEKKFVVVEIQDTGIGIEPDNLEKIFDPFFSTKSHQEGVGLGLSLVHSSIKRNRGRIEVRSRKGQGTSFLVFLPVSTA